MREVQIALKNILDIHTDGMGWWMLWQRMVFSIVVYAGVDHSWPEVGRVCGVPPAPLTVATRYHGAH